MVNSSIGGVQGHSVGPHYPIIVVGYGDGTWTAAYGGVESRRFASSQDATHAASVAHDLLTGFGSAAAKDWLTTHAKPFGHYGEFLAGAKVAPQEKPDAKVAPQDVVTVDGCTVRWANMCWKFASEDTAWAWASFYSLYLRDNTPAGV